MSSLSRSLWIGGGVDNLTGDDGKADESNGHPLPSRGQKIVTLLIHEIRRSDSEETKKKDVKIH